MSAQKPNYNDRLKDYIPVAERIDIFYQQFPQGRIITAILEHDIERGFVLIRAEGYRQSDDAQPAATGHAFEYRESSHVNKTSYIENAETSAAGRMCAMLGIETKRGIASREEMEKVDRMQGVKLQAVQSDDAPMSPQQVAEIKKLKLQNKDNSPTDFSKLNWQSANRLIVQLGGQSL